MASRLPAAGWFLGDREDDADRSREALADRGMTPRIPGQASPGKSARYDKRRYRRRDRIGIVFGRL